MTFTPPKQDRSRQSTDAFLDALEACLNSTGMTRTTIEQVAERAQLGRAAFLRRFGSKREAVLVLYDRYADQCETELDRFGMGIGSYMTAEAFLTDLYAGTEQMQLAHFGLNLAMNQDFAEELETAAGTKRVFHGFLAIMEKLQDRFLPPEAKSVEGRFAASQLIITISLNYTLRATPGLPRDAGRRHALMGQIAWLALRQPAAPK